MPTVLFTQGYPASGKTTYARDREREGFVRISRDDIRALYHLPASGGSASKEALVTGTIGQMMMTALNMGRNVVIDATHFRPHHLASYVGMIRSTGQGFTWDIVPQEPPTLRELLKRDAQRDESLGVDKLTAMYQRYPRSSWATVEQVAALVYDHDHDPYTGLDGIKPPALIVDLDGTVFHALPGTNYLDPRRDVLLDRHDPSVCSLVRIMADSGVAIIAVSGRTEQQREASAFALELVDIIPTELHLRSDDDSRQDAEFKRHLILDTISPRYDIIGALDDRDQVVAMLRSLGITTLQVGYGCF